jgi:hypothetical protein
MQALAAREQHDGLQQHPEVRIDCGAIDRKTGAPKNSKLRAYWR